MSLSAVQAPSFVTNKKLLSWVEEVARLVQQLFEREMMWILLRSRAWQGQLVTVSHTYLSTNRIRVELEHRDHPAIEEPGDRRRLDRSDRLSDPCRPRAGVSKPPLRARWRPLRATPSLRARARP